MQIMVKNINIPMNDQEFFDLLKIKDKLGEGNKITWKEFIKLNKMYVENGKRNKFK